MTNDFPLDGRQIPASSMRSGGCFGGVVQHYDWVGSDTSVLLSVFILFILDPLFLILLFRGDAFLGIERCRIRIGIPPMLKSSLRDFVKNLVSVSDSWVFPLIKATKVGGLAFTWVKYLTFGCVAESFHECLLITCQKELRGTDQ